MLAIESSTSLVGVAASAGGETLFEGFLAEPKVRSCLLLPLCVEALLAAGLKPTDLSAVAVSTGPGSFTGLRIGCATAQGLAHAWKIPVAPVPTFRVLLDQACCSEGGEEMPLYIAIVQGRARAQTVTALYSRESGLGAYKEAVSPGEKSMEGLLDYIEGLPRGRVSVTGDAADMLADLYVERQRTNGPRAGLSLVPESRRLPRPRSVAAAGERMATEGLLVEPRAAIPRYYRVSQAETVMARKAAIRESMG